VTSEPSNSEIMRRLDEVVRQLVDVVKQVRDMQEQAERKYVSRELWLESRKSDQAVVADLAGDMRASEQRAANQMQRVETLEDKRVQARNFAITTAIALSGLGLALLAFIVNRGA